MSGCSAPKRVPLVRVLALLIGVLFVSALSPTPASASTVTTLRQTWGTNGRVSQILADPATGRVYVAGNFTAVTDASGSTTLPIANVAAFLPATGTFDTSWHPNPDGAVYALALSGGTLYLGGNFTQVGGQTRRHLAAVDAGGTGTVAAGWTPGANSTVSTLAVRGGFVYAGGIFTILGGLAQPFLGRVSESGGALDTSWTPRLDARVRSTVVSVDGSRIYVGGDFLTVNGSTVGKSIASLSTATPATLTTGFNAGPTNEGSEPAARDLYLDGSNLLAAVAGSGGGCASLDATTGKTQWSKHSNGNMQAVTAFGGTAYCGVHFNGLGSFDGQTRYKLAAVDETTGTLLAFAPRFNSALGVWSLGHDANLYVGGDFTEVSGKPQPHLAMFN